VRFPRSRASGRERAAEEQNINDSGFGAKVSGLVNTAALVAGVVLERSLTADPLVPSVRAMAVFR